MPSGSVMLQGTADAHRAPWSCVGWHCWGGSSQHPYPAACSKGSTARMVPLPGMLLFPRSAFVSSVCGWNTSAKMSSVPYLQHIRVLLVPTQPPKIAPAEGKNTSLK